MNNPSLVSYTVGLQLPVNLKQDFKSVVDALLISSDERFILMQILQSRERQCGELLLGKSLVRALSDGALWLRHSRGRTRAAVPCVFTYS